MSQNIGRRRPKACPVHPKVYNPRDIQYFSNFKPNIFQTFSNFQPNIFGQRPTFQPNIFGQAPDFPIIPLCLNLYNGSRPVPMRVFFTPFLF